MYCRSTLALCFASLIAFISSAQASVPNYRVCDLTPALGGLADVYDINNNGEIVGDVGGQAFRWSLTGGAEFLTLGDGDSGAWAVNDGGYVAAYAYMSHILPIGWHAYVWNPGGSAKDLGTLPEASSSFVRDISDSGQVLGGAVFQVPQPPRLPAYVHHAVIWDSSGNPTDLGDLFPGKSWDLTAMNNSCLVLGSALMPDGYRPWIRKPNDGTVFLDKRGGGYCEATGINEPGQVVGSLEDASIGEIRATIWNPDGNVARMLAPLGSESFSMGYDINWAGVVVGESSTLTDMDHPTIQATVWNADGTGYELPMLPEDTFSRAKLINDNGCIVGQSWREGEHHVVLWTPVPEPSCAVVLLSGVIGTTLNAERRRRRVNAAVFHN